jgi:hypothetical protein
MTIPTDCPAGSDRAFFWTSGIDINIMSLAANVGFKVWGTEYAAQPEIQNGFRW